MARRSASSAASDRGLRETLVARAQLLRSSASQALPVASTRLATAIRGLDVTAAPHGSGQTLPLVEPIWSFWLDAARLGRLATLLAARQVNASMHGASRIPKLNLPQPLIALLKTWFDEHHDGARAAARAANYRAHYGLRLPGVRGHSGTKPSHILDAFHAVLLEATRRDAASPRAPDGSRLALLLRRLHLCLAQTASRVVDGVSNPDVFKRLGESFALGRADLLSAQWLLARPELSTALRGPILVPAAEPWTAPLDHLRRLTDTIDSLTLFYCDLATTSEALLLSVRFGDWTQASPAAANAWATFWHAEMVRYLVAYQEVTGIPLAEASAADRTAQPADAIERR